MCARGIKYVVLKFIDFSAFKLRSYVKREKRDRYNKNKKLTDSPVLFIDFCCSVSNLLKLDFCVSNTRGGEKRKRKSGEEF